MLSEFLQITGVLLISMALRSSRNLHLRRAGLLTLFLASFLIGFYISGQWEAGTLCALSWLVLPFWRMLRHVKRARLEAEGSFSDSVPFYDARYPALRADSEQLEDAGFEEADDIVLEWGGFRQMMRLFGKQDEAMQVAICLIEQGPYTLHFLRITSKAEDGRVWMTSNYPYSQSLKLPPEYDYGQVLGVADVAALLDAHRARLEAAGITLAQLAPIRLGQLKDDLQTEFEERLAHNLRIGVLLPAGEGTLRYSWRGLFFIWMQLLRDSFRLAL